MIDLSKCGYEDVKNLKEAMTVSVSHEEKFT